MSPSRWSDPAFLDGLRQQGDPLADATVARLIAEHGVDSVDRIFKTMNADPAAPPEDAPAPFVDFLAATGRLPSWVDGERVARGEDAYMRYAFPVALVLLAKSLPDGYAAPALTRILHLSGDLEHHPYKRLMGVLQMVVNVGSRGGLAPQGRGVMTAQKLRLLHAGIRHVADRVLPDYRRRFGVPVNHEDMLATIMGFSYLVVEGLHRLEVGLTDAQGEDLYYLWRIFAQMMGIHPPDDADDPSSVPADLAAAKAFYAAYAERQFTGPEANPGGVVLARHNLQMMIDLLPKLLRRLGLGVLPRIYMNDLMSPQALARVGIGPVAGHSLLKWIFQRVPAWMQRVDDDVPGHAAESFSRLVFQGMVVKSRKGAVEFLVPDSIAAMRKLA